MLADRRTQRVQRECAAVGGVAGYGVLSARASQAERPSPAPLTVVAPEVLRLTALDELGVAADFQALWAYPNPERQEVVAALGRERADRLVAIRSMLDTGATVVAGSDWISEYISGWVAAGSSASL